MIDKDAIRAANAYHEAGHAVVAYTFGWWVNHEGIEIDERQYTGIPGAHRSSWQGAAGGRP